MGFPYYPEMIGIKKYGLLFKHKNVHNFWSASNLWYVNFGKERHHRRSLRNNDRNHPFLFSRLTAKYKSSGSKNNSQKKTDFWQRSSDSNVQKSSKSWEKFIDNHGDPTFLPLLIYIVQYRSNVSLELFYFYSGFRILFLYCMVDVIILFTLWSQDFLIRGLLGSCHLGS